MLIVRRKIYHIRCLIILAMLWHAVLFPNITSAEEAVVVNPFHLNIYGSLSVNRDDRRDIAIIRDLTYQPHDRTNTQAGFSTQPNWRMDSRLGIQAQFNANSQVDLVGQVLLRDRVDHSLDSTTQIAFVVYRPNADFDFRLGRVGYDAFLMSDTRDLGYAYPWVRPPVENYGWIPVYGVDGGDVTYYFGNKNVHWKSKIQFGSGGYTTSIGATPYHCKLENLWSISLSRESKFWHFKTAYSEFLRTTDPIALAPLQNNLDSVMAMDLPGISAEAANLRRNLSFKGAKRSYLTLSAVYDDRTWLAQAELSFAKTPSAIHASNKMGHFGFGRHFGNWLPFVLYSFAYPTNSPLVAQEDWGEQSDLQASAIYVANSTRRNQDTLSIGTRWDFNEHAALKLQLDTIHIQPKGYGLVYRDLAINDQASLVHLLTLSLDFAF